MKKYLLILLLLVVKTITAHSQISKGNYYPNPENKKFEGKWECILKKDTFTVILKSRKKLVKYIYVYNDFVVGEYYWKSKKMGDINSDNLLENGIYAGACNKTEPRLLSASFNDFLFDNTFELSMHLIDSNTVSWTLFPREQFNIGDGPFKDHTKSFLPKTIILKRKN